LGAWTLFFLQTFEDHCSPVPTPLARTSTGVPNKLVTLHSLLCSTLLAVDYLYSICLSLLRDLMELRGCERVFMSWLFSEAIVRQGGKRYRTPLKVIKVILFRGGLLLTGCSRVSWLSVFPLHITQRMSSPLRLLCYGSELQFNLGYYYVYSSDDEQAEDVTTASRSDS